MTGMRTKQKTRSLQLVLVLAVLVTFIAMRANVAHVTARCSDYTPDHRDCVWKERVAYCLVSADMSHTDRAATAGFIGKLGSTARYEFDITGCYAAAW